MHPWLALLGSTTETEVVLSACSTENKRYRRSEAKPFLVMTQEGTAHRCHSLTVVGTGGHPSHQQLAGVYKNGELTIGAIGEGLNVHLLASDTWEMLESEAFNTGKDQDSAGRMYDFLNNSQGEHMIIAIHSFGIWESHLSDELIHALEGIGCSFLKNIQQRRTAGLDYGQPFAFLGRSNIGFGNGNQQVVLANSPKFGELTAVVNRVAMPEKSLGATAKILEGDIGKDKHCCLRYIRAEVVPPALSRGLNDENKVGDFQHDSLKKYNNSKRHS